MTTWGPTSDVYTLPTVRLTSDDAPWLADAAVVSWQVERELVGSTLPGNIRARSGLSIGDASAVVALESGTLTPWSKDSARKVTVGASARLFVQADDGDTLDLGAWLIDPTTGNLTSREIQVDLTEAQFVGRQPKQAIPPRNLAAKAVDPVWMIARLGEQVGYRAAPLPSAGVFVDLPLDGAFDGRTSAYPTASADGLSSWGVLPGDVLVGTTGTGNMTLALDPVAAGAWKAGASIFLTMNPSGRVTVLDGAQKWKVVVDATAGTVAVANNLTATPVSVAYTAGLSADWPKRVQVEVQRIYDPPSSSWTSIRVRARSSSSAAWSSWATHSVSATEANVGIATTYVLLGQDFDGTTVTSVAAGQVAGLQLSTSSTSGWGLAATMRLKPLGGQVQIPYAPAADDAWTTIQNIASANLGAVHLDSDGLLTVRDRNDLAGVGTSGTVTDIGAEWTDLPWTLDPADSADRLEVIALVPAIQETTTAATSTPAPEFWRAEEIVEVPAGGKSVTLNVEVDGKAAEGLFNGFVTPAALTSDPTLASRFSVVCFATARDGSSGMLPTGVFSIAAQQLSPSRASITLRNTGSVPLYLVDANGEPCLILRAWRVATFDTPQMVERGAYADLADHPLTIDLGPYVQRLDDMSDVADYLWARVFSQSTWKASSVRCRLDWSHDIGKVLRLVHSRTGLECKALVTKVAYDGSAGEVAQTLDLVLLPFVWSDFDSTYAADTWTTWDARWSASTWDAFDSDPLDLGA